MDISKRFQLFKLIKQPQETYESMGRFTSYYLDVYDTHEETLEKSGKFLSWNWVCFFSAFFGGEILWLFYRRMYLFAFLIGVVGRSLYELISIKVILFANAGFGPLAAKTFHWIFRLGFTFGFAVLGNALYFHFLKGHLQKGTKKKGTDPFTPIIFLMAQAYFIFKFLPLLLKNNPNVILLLKQILGGGAG